MNAIYSISIYTCTITFPLCFAKHSWVVLNSPEYGENRYEIHSVKNKETKNYFYTNNQPTEEGMSYFSLLFFAFSKAKFKSKKIFELKGIEYKNRILHIEKEIEKYPYKNIYVYFPGPNSNTFTQWIIEKAGQAELVQLPWNAFGKDYCKVGSTKL